MNQIQYTPQRLTVPHPDKKQDRTISVFAHVASNGLAYYRYLNANGKNGRYIILHAASGLWIIPPTLDLRRPKHCKQLIALLDPLADWHQSAKVLPKLVPFQAIRDVLQQAGYLSPC